MAKKEGEINEYFMGVFMICVLVGLVVVFLVMIFGDDPKPRSAEYERQYEMQDPY